MRTPVLVVLSLTLLVSLAAGGPAPVRAASFVVTSSADDANAHDADPGDGFCIDGLGRCTLRAAIEEVNATASADTITFSSAMNITLDTDNGFLWLGQPVTIDASSVWDTPNNRPGVTLSGTNINYGLDITADSCAVYGLYITGFDDAAISVWSAFNNIGGPGAGQRNVLSGNDPNGNGAGVYIAGSSAHDNLIRGNYLGLNPAGNAQQPNYFGVQINGAANNIIGGTAAGSGNYISGNNGNGVKISGPNADGNQLGGNVIGLAADGTTPLGNGNRGVSVSQATGTQIGSGSLPPNTIAYNLVGGVDLRHTSSTTVQGNTIHHNQGDGLYLSDSADSDVFFNTIAYNTSDGVRISDPTSLRNQITSNSIHHNGGKGIRLENGANTILTPPTITGATAGSVSGTASGGARVVYVHSDSSDEGETYHGSCIVNTVTGQWTYSGAIVGPNATAIAADVDGNTSEFSSPVPVSGGSGTCANPRAIACGQSVAGDTTGQANNHSGYTCGWDASGPEIIYSFTLAAGSGYNLTAELPSFSADLDLYLLAAGGCDAGTCLSSTSYGNTSATASNVPAGTYYLAVDGYSGAAGTFDLRLTCTPTAGAQHQIFLPLVVRNR